FFQAEDGIRDATVTGVQTCALPICAVLALNLVGANPQAPVRGLDPQPGISNYFIGNDPRQWHTNIANYSQVGYEGVYPGINLVRSEERRVGRECRSRWWRTREKIIA